MTASSTAPILSSSAHVFRVRSRSFLFDVFTRTSFGLDDAGETASREMLGERSATARAGSEQVEAARIELASLRNRGYFRDLRVRVPHIDSPAWRNLNPIISRRCNLRCRYCYTGHDRERSVMSRAVAEATARFIADQTAPFRQSRRVWFSLVGEPTVDLPLYHEFAKLLAKAGRDQDVTVRASLMLTNLATLDQSAVLDCLPDIITAGVSMDGPQAAHDAMRIRPDGRGTYADVRRGLDILRDAGGRPGAVATVTALYPDVSEIYFHLFDLMFPEVVVKPVRAHPDLEYAIGQNLSGICAGYDRLVDRLLSLPDDDLSARLRVILGSEADDYFGRFLVRAIVRPLMHWRCGAWATEVAIDTDGKLYGCHALLGVEDACVGTVLEGIDEARVRELTEQVHIFRRPPCNQCWARSLCGGGCMHQSYLTFGEFGPPDPDECKLNQHLIKLAIWMMDELQRNRPRVLAALPQWAWRPWQAAPPLLCRQLAPLTGEASMLRASMRDVPPVGVLGMRAVKRRLPSSSDHGELEVRLSWDPGSLYLHLASRETDPDDFWPGIEHVLVDLAIPRELAEPALTRIPPRLEEFEWYLQFDPLTGRAEYRESPCMDEDGQPIPGGVLSMHDGSCLIRLPWESVDMRQPETGAELGLHLTLADRKGGELVWGPSYRALKVRLIA